MITLRNRLSFCFSAILIAGLVIFYAGDLRAQASSFISVIPDLPLIEGLQEDTDAAVVFETASGRIAETVVQGQMTPQKVVNFYAAALPQLGWRLISTVRYQREGEILTFNVSPLEGQDGQIIVEIKLAPAVP